MAGGAVVVVGGAKQVVHGKRGHGTNNEAEYEGLIAGLDAAMKAKATSVHVRGDSQLVIKQLLGEYAVKAQNLRPLFAQAKRLLNGFQQVKLEWVRRAQNVDADQAANDALDA